MSFVLKSSMFALGTVAALAAGSVQAQELRLGSQAGEDTIDNFGIGAGQTIGLYLSNPGAIEIGGLGFSVTSSNDQVGLEFDDSTGLLSGDLVGGGGPLDGELPSVGFFIDPTITATDGLLGTLLLDTSSLSAGDTFTISLGGAGFADVAGGPSPTTFDRVQVTLVPEPTSLALLGLGGLLVARRRR